MHTIEMDRRKLNRRAFRAGGRRQSDLAPCRASAPTCPACLKEGAAVIAGESEDGWWFLCLACDEFWDQRQREAALKAALLPSTEYRRSAMIAWMSGITWFQ